MSVLTSLSIAANIFYGSQLEIDYFSDFTEIIFY